MNQRAFFAIRIGVWLPEQTVGGKEEREKKKKGRREEKKKGTIPWTLGLRQTHTITEDLREEHVKTCTFYGKEREGRKKKRRKQEEAKKLTAITVAKEDKATLSATHDNHNGHPHGH